MQNKDQPKNTDGHHLDEDDLERAEKGTTGKSPLVANEEDAFVPDTELDNPDPATKESAKKNDPTTGGASNH